MASVCLHEMWALILFVCKKNYCFYPFSFILLILFALFPFFSEENLPICFSFSCHSTTRNQLNELTRPKLGLWGNFADLPPPGEDLVSYHIAAVVVILTHTRLN